MERRVLLAIVLTFLVLFGYQVLFPPPPPPVDTAPPTATQPPAPEPPPPSKYCRRMFHCPASGTLNTWIVSAGPRPPSYSAVSTRPLRSRVSRKPSSLLTPKLQAPAVGIVWVGRFPGGHDARLAPIADDLRAARHLVEVVEDIPRWKAGKLLGIVVNALDALYRPSPLRDRVAAALSAEAREVYAAAHPRALDDD